MTRNCIFLIFVAAIFFSCGTTSFDYDGKVRYLGMPSNGLVLVSSEGFGTTEKKAVEDAEQNAIQILLFKGFPNTELEIPLIENEFEVKAKFKAYFDKLLTERDFKKFIPSISAKIQPQKVKGGYRTELLVQMNHVSLRKDLEQNKVIRKFGY